MAYDDTMHHQIEYMYIIKNKHRNAFEIMKKIYERNGIKQMLAFL